MVSSKQSQVIGLCEKLDFDFANKLSIAFRMGCSLWWLAIVCMWIMWACVFMNGMNPMLQPTYSPAAGE